VNAEPLTIAPGAANSSDGRGALFTEKTFYLEEFYGKSLLFALVPPAGQRVTELDSLVRTLRELRRNQTRCIVIVSPYGLPKLLRRMGRLAPPSPPVFNPATGLRSRPYPPDSAVAQIWERLRAGSIVVASTDRGLQAKRSRTSCRATLGSAGGASFAVATT